MNRGACLRVYTGTYRCATCCEPSLCGLVFAEIACECFGVCVCVCVCVCLSAFVFCMHVDIYDRDSRKFSISRGAAVFLR